MCGATSAQKDLQAKQAAFYDQATKHAEVTFGEDQAILKNLTDVYAPILAKGPNQQGFSAEERQNLNTQATEGTGRNYAKAAKAVGENIAAAGGGNVPGIENGADIQRKQEVANSAAEEESKEQSSIVSADWAAGKANFDEASNAMLATSGQLNPTGYSNAATESGNAASKTANDVALASNSWVNAALGAAGAVGAGYAGRKP